MRDQTKAHTASKANTATGRSGCSPKLHRPERLPCVLCSSGFNHKGLAPLRPRADKPEGLWRKRRPTRATPLARKRSSEPKTGVAGGERESRRLRRLSELPSGSCASFRRGKPIPDCNAGSLPKAFQCARLLSHERPAAGAPRQGQAGLNGREPLMTVLGF